MSDSERCAVEPYPICLGVRLTVYPFVPEGLAPYCIQGLQAYQSYESLPLMSFLVDSEASLTKPPLAGSETTKRQLSDQVFSPAPLLNTDIRSDSLHETVQSSFRIVLVVAPDCTTSAEKPSVTSANNSNSSPESDEDGLSAGILGSKDCVQEQIQKIAAKPAKIPTILFLITSLY